MINKLDKLFFYSHPVAVSFDRQAVLFDGTCLMCNSFVRFLDWSKPSTDLLVFSSSKSLLDYCKINSLTIDKKLSLSCNDSTSLDSIIVFPATIAIYDLPPLRICFYCQSINVVA